MGKLFERPAKPFLLGTGSFPWSWEKPPTHGRTARRVPPPDARNVTVIELLPDQGDDDGILLAMDDGDNWSGLNDDEGPSDDGSSVTVEFNFGLDTEAAVISVS